MSTPPLSFSGEPQTPKTETAASSQTSKPEKANSGSVVVYTHEDMSSSKSSSSTPVHADQIAPEIVKNTSQTAQTLFAQTRDEQNTMPHVFQNLSKPQAQAAAEPLTEDDLLNLDLLLEEENLPNRLTKDLRNKLLAKMQIIIDNTYDELLRKKASEIKKKLNPSTAHQPTPSVESQKAVPSLEPRVTRSIQEAGQTLEPPTGLNLEPQDTPSVQEAESSAVPQAEPSVKPQAAKHVPGILTWKPTPITPGKTFERANEVATSTLSEGCMLPTFKGANLPSTSAVKAEQSLEPHQVTPNKASVEPDLEKILLLSEEEMSSFRPEELYNHIATLASSGGEIPNTLSSHDLLRLLKSPLQDDKLSLSKKELLLTELKNKLRNQTLTILKLLEEKQLLSNLSEKQLLSNLSEKQLYSLIRQLQKTPNDDKPVSEKELNILRKLRKILQDKNAKKRLCNLMRQFLNIPEDKRPCFSDKDKIKLNEFRKQILKKQNTNQNQTADVMAPMTPIPMMNSEKEFINFIFDFTTYMEYDHVAHDIINIIDSMVDVMTSKLSEDGKELYAKLKELEVKRKLFLDLKQRLYEPKREGNKNRVIDFTYSKAKEEHDQLKLKLQLDTSGLPDLDNKNFQEKFTNIDQRVLELREKLDIYIDEFKFLYDKDLDILHALCDSALFSKDLIQKIRNLYAELAKSDPKIFAEEVYYAELRNLESKRAICERLGGNQQTPELPRLRPDPDKENSAGIDETFKKFQSEFPDIMSDKGAIENIARSSNQNKKTSNENAQKAQGERLEKYRKLYEEYKEINEKYKKLLTYNNLIISLQKLSEDFEKETDQKNKERLQKEFYFLINENYDYLDRGNLHKQYEKILQQHEDLLFEYKHCLPKYKESFLDYENWLQQYEGSLPRLPLEKTESSLTQSTPHSPPPLPPPPSSPVPNLSLLVREDMAGEAVQTTSSPTKLTEKEIARIKQLYAELSKLNPKRFAHVLQQYAYIPAPPKEPAASPTPDPTSNSTS